MAFPMKATPNPTGGKISMGGGKLMGPLSKEMSGGFKLGTGRSKGGRRSKGK